MNYRCMNILIIVLILIIANTGFVRADIQLCQAECEYSAMNSAALSPCCKTKKTVTPVMVMAEHDAAIPSDCPHFGSNRDISDPLAFVSSANALPVPQQAAALAATPASLIQIPDTRFSGQYTRTGLSPPGRKIPPVYRLNCSLLI